MRLLIKTVDNDGRLSLVSRFLDTPWEFEVVDVDDLDAFERALERADAMVSMNWRWDVALPLTDDTRGLLDRAALSSMRSTAVLINVARGAIVDEEALYAALKDRRIGGAILDVWYRYPSRQRPDPTRPSAFPFHDLDNVLLLRTPPGRRTVGSPDAIAPLR